MINHKKTVTETSPELRWLAELVARGGSEKAKALLGMIKAASETEGSKLSFKTAGGKTMIYYGKRFGSIPALPEQAREITSNVIGRLARNLGVLPEKDAKKEVSIDEGLKGAVRTRILSVDEEIDILAKGSPEEKKDIALHTTNFATQDMILMDLGNPDFRDVVLNLIRNQSLHPEVANHIIGYYSEITDIGIRGAISDMARVRGIYLYTGRSSRRTDEGLPTAVRV